MKSLLTLSFVLFIGIVAQAQSSAKEIKVETLVMGIATETVGKDLQLDTTKQFAGLYLFKYSKIKKALSFTTKRDSAKLV